MTSVFKNAIKTVSNTLTTVYTAPASSGSVSGKTSYIIECDIACVGTSGVQVSVVLVKDTTPTTSAYIVKGAPVPVGSAIQVVDGQKIVLEPGDAIKVRCDTAGESVDVIVSLVEDVNS